MPAASAELDVVLIVDDEQSVRRTFQEWLDDAHLGCRILTAEDAESALREANRQAVDLAILDWNLGAGNDGLQLLEDLSLFNPDVVAILVTGYAHQATPLDAMRMGVRDYLDKNQNLNRDTFVSAVRRQLSRLRPAKRERLLHRNLVAFREAVTKVLDLVRSTAVLTDPVPLPQAIHGLLTFLMGSTGAQYGVLISRSHDPNRQPPEMFRAYDSSGAALQGPWVPFEKSLAATVVSLQEPCLMTGLDLGGGPGFELQPFERGHTSILAAPLVVGPHIHVVLELFDKRASTSQSAPDAFTALDRQLLGAAARLGEDLLKQALAERQYSKMLFDAVEAALSAGESVTQTLGVQESPHEDAVPDAVLDQLRRGLAVAEGDQAVAAPTIELAEAIRVLGHRHGPPALRHCLRMVEQVTAVLDAVTGVAPESVSARPPL
jgi:ActR/RegA family two-component response regulator